MKKLSDLRPCDRCGGPVNPTFYVVDVATMVVNQTRVREHVGLATLLGGGSRASEIALAMGTGESDDCIGILSKATVVLCVACGPDAAGEVLMLGEKKGGE